MLNNSRSLNDDEFNFVELSSGDELLNSQSLNTAMSSTLEHLSEMSC